MKPIEVYKTLLEEYGPAINYWPQWCAKNNSIEEREKIIIGMILCQRTSWHNANIALKNLKKANLLSINKIAELEDLEELTQLTRPAGFFTTKPQRLFDMCCFIKNKGGVAKLLKENPQKLREELLELKGVGKETADTILLYSFDKPCFIIDEYTYRWVEANNIFSERNYDKLQEFLVSNLPVDVDLYKDLHALIIISQRGRERSMMEMV